jgi:hypothetical protein
MPATTIDVNEDGMLVLMVEDEAGNADPVILGDALDDHTLDDPRLADVFDDAVDMCSAYLEAVRCTVEYAREQHYARLESRGDR